MTKPAVEAIAIGASAGAIEALLELLPALPANFPVPVMIVVHLPGDQKSLLVDVFSAKCQLPVQEPDDKEPIRPGRIYVAPPDYHLLVEHERVFSLSNEEQVNYCRPSIDVLFETAAETYTTGLVGVILTGANHDGAAGLRQVLDAGGTALIQEPSTAFAAAMPESARLACPEARLLELAEIVHFVQECV